MRGALPQALYAAAIFIDQIFTEHDVGPGPELCPSSHHPRRNNSLDQGVANVSVKDQVRSIIGLWLIQSLA